MANTRNFDLIDYLVFGAVLLISVAIGVYFAIKGQRTTKEFLMGSRKMPIIPTALSILVSFYSGILLLGSSSEMYMNGMQYMWYIPGAVCGLLMAAFIYMPIFYHLKMTSSYEYLEKRFKSKTVRVIGSVFYILQSNMYMAIVLYAPSIAMSAVTNFHHHSIIAATGAICTLYTMLGGLKAVVWTDAFQAIVMYAGLIAIVVQALLDVGPEEAWRRIVEGGRTKTEYKKVKIVAQAVDVNKLFPFSYSFDLFTYMNVWVVFFGTAFGWMAVYGTNQSSVQRYCSLATLKKARLSLLLCLPGMLTLVPLVYACGLSMYAYYAKCDPLLLGAVKTRDQLLPYFTMEILGHAPGMPGIFVSCLFSGTLSTVSSVLNSLAAVLWEDFLKHFFPRITEKNATSINKGLVVFFGVVSIALAYVAENLGGVFEGATTTLSALGGPAAALFLLGILCPFANAKGAIAGVVASSGIMMWICIGAQMNKPYRQSFLRTISNCSNSTLEFAGVWDRYYNQSMYSVEPPLPTNPTMSGYEVIYKLSYFFYGTAAIIIVFLVAIPVSLLTGGRLPTADEDRKLTWPGWYYVLCCLPGNIRGLLKADTPLRNEYTDQDPDSEDLVEEKSMRSVRSKENFGVVQYYSNDKLDGAGQPMLRKEQVAFDDYSP